MLFSEGGGGLNIVFGPKNRPWRKVEKRENWNIVLVPLSAAFYPHPRQVSLSHRQSRHWKHEQRHLLFHFIDLICREQATLRSAGPLYHTRENVSLVSSLSLRSL